MIVKRKEVSLQERKKERKCKLVIFSDIHYAPEPPVKNGSIIKRKLVHYAIPLVKQLIDKINHSIHPDMVINLGDLIEDFNDHDKDIVNLNFIWRMLMEIKPSFYSVPGNHDLRTMNSRVEVEEIMGYEHSTFSVDSKGYHFVFLGLEIKKEVGTLEGGIQKARSISKEDITWLKKDLQQNSLPCMVFTHYGIAEDDMKDNWWFGQCSNSALLENRNELKEILENHKPLLAVFSGHQHWTKKVIENGIPYYVIGSLTEDIKENGIPDGVYFEIDIKQDTINVKEHHLKV